MNLKTFTADSMKDGLALVKRALGKDAVILHTRTVRRGGVLGIGAKNVVEITATNDLRVPRPLARKGPRPARVGPNPLLTRSAAVRPNGTGPTPGADWPRTTGTVWPPNGGRGAEDGLSRSVSVGDDLRKEMKAIRKMVQNLLQTQKGPAQPALPEQLYETYVDLMEQQVAEELARELVKKIQAELGDDGLRDHEWIRERMLACVAAMVPAGGPISADRVGCAKRVAFVGPTGVGKTTTIAKLAANFKLREQKRVGLITIDTYRIAAVDQLRVYAQIIDIPLRVVLTPVELVEALEAMRELDIVLIDTAGRSQNDEMKMERLRSFLDAASPDEVHLVLASTSQQGNLLRVIERFNQVGINRIVFTKLDEAVTFGVILNVVKQVDTQLSYITAGQDVPEDIEVAGCERIAELIVGTDGGT